MENTLTVIQEEIVSIISEQWTKYPNLRFGQLLYNLDINQFANMVNPSLEDNQYSDIHSNSDINILNRIKNSKQYKNG